MTPLWSLAVLPLVTLGLTALNAWTWPRGRAGVRSDRRVSVLIPARDEAEHIEAAVTAVLRSGHAVHEVIVYDDGSTDGTAGILAGIVDPRLRVLHGVPLPPGWVGKPHACHRLSEAATGDLLLFLDADVQLAAEGLERIVALLSELDADVVTAVPRQRMPTAAEGALMPLLHLTYSSWLPLALVHRVPWPSVLAANGQLLAVRREAYDAVGGFAAIRDQVVDDMAFCRRVKAAGRRVVFADGDALAACRMYGSLSEIWEGFSKNVYQGLGSPLLLAVAVALYLGAFVAPWIAGLAAAWVPALAAPAAVGIGANIAQRVLLAVRHHHPLWSVALHPLAVLVLVAIALNSWRWARSGRIRWAGRTYDTSGVQVG